MARGRKWLRVVMTVLVAIALLFGMWEGYKWIGQQTGDYWPGTSIEFPASTDDLTMPHAMDIAEELFEEVRDGRSRLPLFLFLLKKGWFRFKRRPSGSPSV